MSDKFHPLSLPELLRLTLSGVRHNRFMGIPGTLFYRPQPGDPFGMTRYGQPLETPVGVAAGPHTQLALNIVAAWLCGARYIELKTIQTLDELEVTKPCISMQDEGYNCEWSQELKIRESFTEYLHAWMLIHILRKEMGFPGSGGTLFNMSVGYDLAGIQNENVQWFFDRMRDCGPELAAARNSIRSLYPAIDSLQIPSTISDHVTLSTMHGCPPGEIEKIGLYLLRERNLHLTVKLNPTLLGPEALRGMLNDTLGFPTRVPDVAFEHDLKYPDALKILESLRQAAAGCGREFGVKLTNTLETINHRDLLPQSEKMVYMSGRALHPLSICLAHRLQQDHGGALDISFSAGVDCFNVADVLACGLKPVTVCSDLLKPGGYGRLHQYLENLRNALSSSHATSLEAYIVARAGGDKEVTAAALANLTAYAERVTGNPSFHRDRSGDPLIKTERALNWFDCIHAPCTDTCPTHQEIPEYMHHTAAGDLPAAFATVFRTNPFPSVTGMICDHLCQIKCTRINYDESVKIREIKRYIAESTPAVALPPAHSIQGEGRIAIVGAGPAGLSCAWFLRQAGMEVDIYEQKKETGGMVAAAIPSFRLSTEAIRTDVDRILASGVRLHEGVEVDKAIFGNLQKECRAVFLAAGAQRSARFVIEGTEAAGVIDPLEFLFAARQGISVLPGRHVVIIGGGNTAMDAARTAARLVGKEGSVTIVYRRTIAEMPADRGEIHAVLEEGIRIVELTSPLRILMHDGKVGSLECQRNTLAEAGSGKRPIPVPVPDSEFVISCDTVIPAIGQELAIDFIEPALLRTEPGTYRTARPGLYIGGDALRGASTAINAIADGRKAAMEILADLSPISGPAASRNYPADRPGVDIGSLLHRKSIREYSAVKHNSLAGNELTFDLTDPALDDETARSEAARCLQCDLICNACVSVCPNLANYGYTIGSIEYSLQKAVLMEDGTVGFVPDTVFRVDQPYQVLNLRDLCNECGNCATFCPSAGRPFADKPGLCLSLASLKTEKEGFYLSRLAGKDVLIYMENGHVRTLTLADDKYTYETEQIRATFNAVTFEPLEAKFLTPCVKEFRFGFAAEMSVVMQGAREVSTGN
ncbi:MAG TPA: FAD-dependent oxidoreductase [Bacteroidales bacterium]|nr:FAD-dependent oxidoreductase [Bacteroidales bacterium]